MRLSQAARDKAPLVFHALSNAPDADAAKSILQKEGFTVDYVEEHWGRRLAAVFLEGVRLIDNMPLPAKEDDRASLS